MSDVSQFVSNWRLIGNVIAVLSGKSRARNELAAVVVAVRRLALPLFGVLRRGAARQMDPLAAPSCLPLSVRRELELER